MGHLVRAGVALLSAVKPRAPRVCCADAVAWSVHIKHARPDCAARSSRVHSMAQLHMSVLCGRRDRV
jgi:hypothetical protein